MSSKAVEDLKEIAYKLKDEYPSIIMAIHYIENIENSTFSKNIISLGEFENEYNKNPDSKRVDIIKDKK